MQVYMDNAATTKPEKEVVKTVEKALTEFYGNPSSIHFKGCEAEEKINDVRKVVARELNAKMEEIIFCSGGAEANSLSIKGLVKASGKKHVITTAIEHASIINSCETLKKEGCKVTFIGVDKDGLVNPKDIEKAITKDTALVSVMHANNEIGTIEPLEEIGKICKKHNVLFHTDAVQSFLKLKINVKKFNLDALSLSSHKIHGPKGTGVLYLKQGTKIEKLVEGGKQELGIRPGTQNVPGILGLGKAVEVWSDKHDMKKLRDHIIKRILTEIKKSKLNGHETKRLDNNVNVSFPDLEGETILLHMSYLNVAVGTGSACHEKMIKVSHVLNAIGLDKDTAKGAVRLTLNRHTTKNEADFAVDQLKTVVESLRKVE